LLIKKKGAVSASDLVEQFQYSAATARSYLAYLTRQDLLLPNGPTRALSAKGEERLDFYEKAGCPDPRCPLCHRDSGGVKCRTCGSVYKLSELRIRALWETAFFSRAPGVYCEVCQAQIMTERQAGMIGVKAEGTRA